jgi:hypothetical protein
MYRHFVSQSSEFCCHNTLCCFSTSVCCLFRYRFSPETFGYTVVDEKVILEGIVGKLGGKLLTGLIWLRIGSNGGFL